MDINYKIVLEQNRAPIIDDLDKGKLPSIYRLLRTRGVMIPANEEAFKLNATESDQIGRLLDFLKPRPKDQIEIFLEILFELGEGYIVTKYINKIYQNKKKMATGDTTSSPKRGDTLNRKIEYDELSRLAGELIEWEKFAADYLKVSRTQIKKAKAQKDLYEQAIHVLSFWQNSKSPTARELVDLLQAAKKDGYIEQEALDILKLDGTDNLDTVDSAIPAMTSGPVKDSGKSEQPKPKKKCEHNTAKCIPLTKELEKLEMSIHPNKEEKAQNKVIANNIVDRLIESLKDMDGKFHKYYSKKEFVGSIYDKLRVSNAGEFDFDVVIYFSDSFKYTSSSGGTSNEFCKLQLLDDQRQGDYEWCLADSTKNKKYVDPTKIYKWFYDLIIANALKKNESWKHIKIEQNKPAVTLLIETKGGTQLDVDLAVAIEGYGLPHGADSNSLKEQNLKEDLNKISGLSKVPRKSEWHFTCPKDNSTDDEDGHLYFRISTALLEKRFLKNMDKNMDKRDKRDSGCRKDVLRLLKQLRITQKWPEIKSYALKSLIMQYACKGGENYWHKERMGDCFLDMLGHLEKSLREPYTNGIRSYFYPDRKLLTEIESGTAKAKSVENIIDKLKINPEKIKEYIQRNQ